MSEIRAIKQHAMQLYNQECIDTGKSIFSPQLGHKCTNKCPRRYFPQLSVPVSICTNSWVVHVCGKTYCNMAEVDHAGGSYVCPLTQQCFAQILEHHVTHSRTKPTETIGADRVKMDRVARKRVGDNNVSEEKRARTTVSPKNLDVSGRYDCIKRCLRTYLTDSPERIAIYRTQLERFYREDIKMARTMYRTQEYIRIDQVFLEVENHIAQMGKLLNPPSTQLAAEHIATLATSFNDYYARVMEAAARNKIEMTSTQRQVEIYTACMCYFLAEGFSIGETVIIPADEWFAFHTPHIKTYGNFLNQQCRNMSKFERQFQEICIAPMTNSAFYGLLYSLPESFTSRWQRRPRTLSVCSPSSTDSTPPARPTPRARMAATAGTHAFAV